MDEALRCAARVHCKDMAENAYFDHTSQNGDTHTSRARKAGSSASSENIASGQRSPASVMSSWMSSPGHCKNIMQGGHKRVGIGYYNNMWTMLLGG